MSMSRTKMMVCHYTRSERSEGPNHKEACYEVASNGGLGSVDHSGQHYLGP